MTTQPRNSRGPVDGATTDRRPAPEPPDAVFWFARLVAAVEAGDVAGARKAGRELRRLNFSVVPMTSRMGTGGRRA